MRRSFIAAAAVATLVLGTGSIALAQEYPVETGPLFVSDSSPPPGGTVRITGSGFAPGAFVQLTMASVSLGSTSADGAGSIDTTVTIPANTEPGTHTLKAIGADPSGGTLILSATITVGGAPAAEPAPTRRALAFTGGPAVALAAVGAVLLVAGLILVLARRARSRTAV